MISDFKLERYLARHEFTAPYLLSCSDCESMTVREVLDLEPGAREKFETLWLGYTEAPGSPALREAICSLYAGISAEQVLVHAGAEDAIYGFGMANFSQGDCVVVQTPCYQSLAEVARFLGAEVVPWLPDSESPWTWSLEGLKKIWRPHTKALVMNAPHNPTGFLFGEPEFRAIGQWVDSAGALWFVDEVYRGLEHEAGIRLPAACDLSPGAISLGVMSKTYGLAGLRIGWVASQNAEVMKRMASFKDYTSICNSGPSEYLATIALRHADKIVARNLEIIKANLKLAQDFFERHHEEFEWHRPVAGCIAFPKWEGKGTASEFCQRLVESKGVLLAPGPLFDGGENHFRIGFGRKNFPEGLSHLSAYLA